MEHGSLGDVAISVGGTDGPVIEEQEITGRFHDPHRRAQARRRDRVALEVGIQSRGVGLDVMDLRPVLRLVERDVAALLTEHKIVVFEVGKDTVTRRKIELIGVTRRWPPEVPGWWSPET